MKFPILLVASILFFLQSFAQKVHFTDTSNRWVVHGTNGDGQDVNVTAYYSHDTITTAHTYHVLLSCTSVLGLTSYQQDYVREDTATGLVYAFGQSDTSEQVVFNYNLLPGDTQRISGMRDSVTALDSVLIDGVYHRRLSIIRDHFSRMTIVEGMGCMTAPLFPLHSACFENESDIVCFINNAAYPATSFDFSTCYHTRHFTNSSYCTDQVPDIPRPEMVLAPNPATNRVSIANIPSGSVYVYNMLSSCVWSASVTNNNKLDINVDSWPRGIYQLVSTGGAHTALRFVLE